jgi:spore photoproduct lyase
MKTKDFIKKVYIHKSALTYSQDILKKLDMPYEILPDNININGDKTTLLISTKRGGFVKNCPCSKDSISCGYYNINLVEGCFFDCSYCILQLYLKDKPVTLYANFNDLINELDLLLSNKRFVRIGPGELADCLCLDDISGYSAGLVEYFKDKNNALLEIKTKDADIQRLFDYDHGGRTVISFSLNSKLICEKEEKGASSLDERIYAAKEALRAGYKTAFHFDPVIIYDNYLKEYEHTLDIIAKNIDKKKIAWISVGLLRYPSELSSIIRERHPQSFILTGESVKCDNFKMRYFITFRKKTYDNIFKLIKKRFEGVNCYICMDTQNLWDIVLNKEQVLKSLNAQNY